MDKKKILAALILLPVFVWLVGWGPIWLIFAIVLLLGAGLGGWESAKLAFGEDETSWRKLATALSMLACVASATGDDTSIVMALLGIFFLAFVATSLFSGELNRTLLRTAKLMFVALYPGLLIGYLIALKGYEPLVHGSKLLMMLFALVWVNDSGAYFTGKLKGKRKFAPVISPNKTWEGAIGGFVATLLLGLLIGWASPSFTAGQGLTLGVVLGIAGPVGDLLESAIKRGAGVKDSGTLLPGHGGVLDRIDSVIACAPIFYYYVAYSQHAGVLHWLAIGPQ